MPTDIQTLAQNIFTDWAAQAGPQHWQWDEMAQAAFNAASRFAAITDTASASATAPVSDPATDVTAT